MTEDLRAAVDALQKPPHPSQSPVTSDLSVDETLLLHGAGFEPADLVAAVSIHAIPYQSFYVPVTQTTPLAIEGAADSVSGAFRDAASRLRSYCAQSGGIGVVGVEVSVAIGQHTTRVALTGTAIRRVGAKATSAARPFVTDLSTRDFVLLGQAGWEPLDLVSGAGFVSTPYRGIRQSIAQTTQNVELVNLTQALQDARELGMERMQKEALAVAAGGVVAVSVLDGPLGHSRHVLAFVCYGTAVHLVAERHKKIEPELVLSIDDHSGFEASAVV